MLPLACVSNDKKGISLINPQAVNLDAYKEKLEQAIKSYERQVYSPEIYVCGRVSVFFLGTGYFLTHALLNTHNSACWHTLIHHQHVGEMFIFFKIADCKNR